MEHINGTLYILGLRRLSSHRTEEEVSFQCRGVLLLLHIVEQGPGVLAAGAGRVDYIFFLFFIYLPFLMSCLLGDG